jgi:hypothetical protein
MTRCTDSERRHYKAQKTIAVILDYLGQAGLDGRDFSLLDMGCSTGYMSHACVFRGNSATDSGVNRPPSPAVYAKRDNHDYPAPFFIQRTKSVSASLKGSTTKSGFYNDGPTAIVTMNISS